MNIKIPKIYTLDGPAGSGKSYAIRKLAKEYGWYSALDIGSTSRNELGIAGQMQQAKRNLTAVVDAVQAVFSKETYNAVVIDRGTVSNFVYTRLSEDTYQPSLRQNLKRQLECFQTALNMLAYTTQQKPAKLSDTPFWPVNYIILLPSKSRMESNRFQSDKEYPFSVDAELDMWYNAITGIENLSLPGISLTVLEEGDYADAINELSE